MNTNQQISILAESGSSYPPDVGIALPKSAMAMPTMKMNMLARNQDHTIPAGPDGIE